MGQRLEKVGEVKTDGLWASIEDPSWGEKDNLNNWSFDYEMGLDIF